jgi:hypothetical protein
MSLACSPHNFLYTSSSFWNLSSIVIAFSATYTKVPYSSIYPIVRANMEIQLRVKGVITHNLVPSITYPGE